MSERQDSRRFFSASVEQSMDALYGAALRLTRSGADAEDLVAESVAKAWSAIDTLEDRRRFRPWMFRILRNCFVSDYRKRSIRPVEVLYDESFRDEGEADLASLLIEQSDEFLAWWADPEHELINERLGEEIRTAIETLPESYRVTVLLVNVEGLGYDEAAEVLGVPPGTVRSRMKRGRTLLQKALWEQALDAGLVAPDDTDEVNR
jgi:RNA polymerase sigma-70 factor (ECF subfamily)